jgi:hypothetical protein
VDGFLLGDFTLRWLIVGRRVVVGGGVQWLLVLDEAIEQEILVAGDLQQALLVLTEVFLEEFVLLKKCLLNVWDVFFL